MTGRESTLKPFFFIYLFFYFGFKLDVSRGRLSFETQLNGLKSHSFAQWEPYSPNCGFSKWVGWFIISSPSLLWLQVLASADVVQWMEGTYCLSLSPGAPDMELGSFFCFSKIGWSRSEACFGEKPEVRHVCLSSSINTSWWVLFAFEDLGKKYFVLTLCYIELPARNLLGIFFAMF